ncbi:hypothetical protein Q1695_015902 [Nippostrongylus brasiliensis]|nr:hypothetical protein Q1695_015902 [Nippostrongylus brasiliensis]
MMCATKYLLLLCFLPVVYGANPSGCTIRTIKHWRTATDFFNSIFPYDVMFDCICAERAEGLAWVTAIGAKTDDYSEYYNIYNITEIGGDQPENERIKSMLTKIVDANPQIMKFHKNGHYGCAYSTGVVTTTHVVTCIFKKTSGRCIV